MQTTSLITMFRARHNRFNTTPTRLLFYSFSLLCSTYTNNALADCIAAPTFFVGESATYRFTESDSSFSNVSVHVSSEEKYWYVLDVIDNGAQSRHVVETGCFDTGIPEDYTAPDYPTYFTNSRLTSIIQPDASPFSANQFEKNGSFDQYNCNFAAFEFIPQLDRSLFVDSCQVTASSGNSVEEVNRASSLIVSPNNTAPLGGLITKTQFLNNGSTRSIELVDIGGNYPDDGSPEPVPSLQGLIYSATAVEILWDRPEDNRAALFEVQRDNNIVGVFDALSYYDGNTTPNRYHEYSVTAIDGGGNRSVTMNVVPSLYNYRFVGDYTPPVSSVGSPQNVIGRVYSNTAAEIFWQPPASSLGTLNYEVTRNGESVAITGGNSYFDDTLNPGTRYNFSVTTLSPTGARSSDSNTTITTTGNATVISTRPQPTDPLTPTFELRADVYSMTAAELFWDAQGGVAQRYEVYQDGDFVALIGGTSYFTDELLAGTQYEFTVYSFDLEGNLDTASTATSITTPGIRDESVEIRPPMVTVFNPSPEIQPVSTSLLRIGDWTNLGNELFNPARYQVFRDQENLNEFHASLYNCDCEVEPLPDIDFSQSTVLFVAHSFSPGGTPTTTIESASLQGNLLTVEVLDSEAGIDCPVDSAISGEFRYYVADTVAPEVNFEPRIVYGEACD